MSRIAIVGGLFALGLAPAILGACGLRSSSSLPLQEGSDAAGNPAPVKVCVPGQETSCVCGDGLDGVQICALGGEGYGPCACTSPIPTPIPVEDAGGPILDDAGGPPSPSWPSPPTGGTTPPVTSATTFAVHHIHLGDELDSNGNPDWYEYGYNLDGKVTTATSTDVCTLANNANKKNQTDGPGGIDNSFGENFIPLLSAVIANPSQGEDTALAGGSFGWILSVQGLASTPTQTSTGLVGQFFLGVPFGQTPNAPGATPTFTQADDWPVDQALVTSAVNGSGQLVLPATSAYAFPAAYVVGGELVTGAPASVQLVLGISGQLLHLNLQHAVITFNHTSGASASGGIVAGVIATQDLVNAMKTIAGNISTSLCGSATFAQIATAIEQAADIMTDGTNVAGTPCNGISVGIGFDANEIQAPQYAGAFPAAADPCDGG